MIYGGRSGEHEVSLASAAAVFANLDPARYEAVAIRIDKDGRWTLPDRPPSRPVAKPQAPVSEYAPRPAPQGLDAHGRTTPANPQQPDDHLDIPAFLRRQST